MQQNNTHALEKKRCFNEFIQNADLSDSIDLCDCPLECRTDGYNFVYSSADNLKHPNDTDIYIFYDEIQETITKESPQTQLADLIANLGGVITLFTGFSFLSMVELVELVIHITIILFDCDKRENETSNNATAATSTNEVEGEENNLNQTV